MATEDFELIDGTPRLRLDEEQWSAVFAASRATVEQAGALAPLTEPRGPRRHGDDVVAAATLAAGEAAVRIDVTSAAVGAGVVASLGTDGAVAAGVARALAMPDDGRPTELVPGVELSLVRAEHLVGEVLRLLPPDPPLADDRPRAPVTLSHDQSLLLSAAIRDDDASLVATIAADQGWDEVPEVLRSLAEDVRANAAVAIRVAGSDHLLAYRWLQCRLGWVQIGMHRGQVVHTPCDRAAMAGELVHALAGAFEHRLAGVGTDG